nr:hypothetical protein BaRGS_031540 [Batillaria attramentaria]
MMMMMMIVVVLVDRRKRIRKTNETGSETEADDAPRKTRKHRQSEKNATTHPDKVTIAGAVSVDLKTVHDKLALPEDEFIVSPVVEYVTDGEEPLFEKPLRIYLPHFLPDSFSARDDPLSEADEKQFIVHKTLSAVSNFSGTAFGARLSLEEDDDKWRHRKRSLPEQTLELEDFRPCCPDCDFHRLDWRVESKPDSPIVQWFKGVLEVGYLDSAATIFQFRARPKSEKMYADLEEVGPFQEGA